MKADSSKMKCGGVRVEREARRQHILEANVTCVRASGFHGASMMEIAKEAGISVSAIYRYFASKEAIIEAIVADDAADIQEKFQEWDTTPDCELVSRLCDIVEPAIKRNRDPRRAALSLEILAEAARNPRIGEIVRQAGLNQRELRGKLWRRIAPALSSSTQAARAEVLAMVFDGLMSQSLSNPNLDETSIADAIRIVVRALMSS